MYQDDGLHYQTEHHTMRLGAFGELCLVLCCLTPGNTTSHTLSRKRRYLTFPEGSSLQLVYCLTVPTLIPNTIFNYGWTAGVAWELPSDARQLFGKKKKGEGSNMMNNGMDHNGLDHGGMDHNGMEYGMDHGIIYGMDYKTASERLQNVKQSLINGKYPQSNVKYGYYPRVESSNNYGNAKYAKYHGLKYDLKPREKWLHRRHRRDVFSKLEPFLEAIGLEGRTCVLRALCETGQRSGEKGGFMDEILHTIFRFPSGDVTLDEEDLSHYDKAHQATDDCADLFPDCTTSIHELGLYDD